MDGIIKNIACIFLGIFFIDFVFASQKSGGLFEIQSLESKISISGTEKVVRNRIFIKTSHLKTPIEFVYPLSEEYEVIPLEVGSNKKDYNFKISNRSVVFEIFNPSEQMELAFSYKTLNNQKFMQVQPIFIPHFKNAFNASLEVLVDKKWEIFSSNNSFVGSKYVWKGQIKKNSFKDTLWLSLKQASFEVNITNYIYSSKNIPKLNLVLPKYFKDSPIRVQRQTFTPNLKNARVLNQTNNTTIVFDNAQSRDLEVTLNSIVINSISGKKSQYQNLNPKDFLSNSQSPYLNALAKKILRENPSIPPYLALAHWIHNHIRYDLSFVGKHMNSEDILRLGAGVCEHYAQSYAEMLQALGIPSAFVTGVAFNPHSRKFEYHAWNIVYSEDKWIPIDATWGLFGGVLPVSHIFFFLGYQPAMMYEVYGGALKDMHSEVKHSIKFISNK